MKVFKTLCITAALACSLISPYALADDNNKLKVIEGTFTDPDKHSAVMKIENISDADLICDVKVIGLIRGTSTTGVELVARQSSDSVPDFLLKKNRAQERRFDFTNAVMRMRAIWKDSRATLSEVDPSSLISECRPAEEGPKAVCKWQGATVDVGQWLECKTCVYKYCQCQSTGAWGQCGNTAPSTGACDWTNPDWTNPACTEGGSKPCDWTNPDWTNPACSGN